MKETIHIAGICIDPMGDSHGADDFYCPPPRVFSIDGGEWDRRSCREECYPIHMIGGNPYARDIYARDLSGCAMRIAY